MTAQAYRAEHHGNIWHASLDDIDKALAIELPVRPLYKDLQGQPRKDVCLLCHINSQIVSRTRGIAQRVSTLPVFWVHSRLNGSKAQGPHDVLDCLDIFVAIKVDSPNDRFYGRSHGAGRHGSPLGVIENHETVEAIGSTNGIQIRIGHSRRDSSLNHAL